MYSRAAGATSGGALFELAAAATGIPLDAHFGAQQSIYMKYNNLATKRQ
jgi:hypothetical protein